MSQKFQEIISSEKPVLIDFFAVWCQPCRVQSSVLVTVKEQVGDNARIIKIDVEGAEYNALLGCQGIIERHKPTIVSEFSPDLMPGISHITGPEYLKWLLSLGYKLGVVDTLDGHPTNQDMSIEAIMDAYYARSADHIDILARPQ